MNNCWCGKRSSDCGHPPYQAEHDKRHPDEVPGLRRCCSCGEEFWGTAKEPECLYCREL